MSKSVIIDNLVNDQLYGFRIFPRNLKGQYQTETDGATATATPKAIDPIFGNNTWEVINLASTTNTIPSTWHIGDTKDITLTTGETLTMQIYGFKHDDLTSGGKAGITLGMKNLMEDKKQMNRTITTIGGFTGSDLYTWLQNDLYNSLPIDLKPYIKSINKKTSAGNKSITINTNSMKVFLFSEVEIFGKKTYSVTGEGEQYSYFNIDINRTKKSLSNGNGITWLWWQRSPKYDSSGYFCNVSNSGVVDYNGASDLYGVCFGFCI